LTSIIATTINYEYCIHDWAIFSTTQLWLQFIKYSGKRLTMIGGECALNEETEAGQFFLSATI